MKISTTRARTIGALMTSVALVAMVPQTTLAQNTVGATQQINIAAQPLEDALVAIGREFGVAIAAPNALVNGKTAPPVNGSYSASEALSLALADSGLGTSQTANGDFVITRRADVAALSEDLITETLVVTGSRIERTAVNSPAPIDIVTAEDIATFGLTDTTEALRFSPALQQSISLSQIGEPFSGEDDFGLATLDLRGLGANRTLVLVNGRRHVGGVANEATVDVSTIPTALLERVEVLTGGASSIYGADAVSGVVNYILKDDFEGVDVRSNVSLPTQGGGEAYFGAITVGGNFGGGRGNAVLNVEYNKQTNLRNRDRAASSTSQSVVRNSPIISAALGVSEEFQNVLIPDYRFTFLSLGPLFTLAGNEVTFPGVVGPGQLEIGGVPTAQIIDPVTGEIRPQNFGRYNDGGFFTSGGDGILEFYGNPEADSVPELDRYVVSSFADYDFTDYLTGFVEVKYARSESAGRSNRPRTRVLSLSVNPENPFVPELVQNQFASLESQGLDPAIEVSREFFDEVATGPVETERQTFRIVGGFKGDVSKALSYEISANYGRTDTRVADNSELLPDRLLAAADAITDPLTGDIICRSDVDPNTLPPTAILPRVATPGFRSFTPGDGSCAPLNIFASLDGIDPAATDFILQRVENTFQLEQFVLNAVMTGNSEDFFSLPAGGINYAAGVEYRDESSSFVANPLQVNRLDNSQTLNRPNVVEGNFSVFEGFGEVSVPLLSDLPFVKSLVIDASIRVADYSTIGTATSFGFGGVWQPVDDFRFRASFNRAVRAPNISELFQPRNEGPGQLTPGQDPCDPVAIDEGSSTRRENCAQLIPDLSNFDPSPAYQSGNITFIRGGSPNLDAERADTFTIGFVYTPQAVPGLTIVTDYYNIEIDGAVATLGREIALRCVDSPTVDNRFCNAVTRNANTGAIEAIDTGLLNLGATRSSGIDYQISYGFDLDELLNGNYGDFNVGVSGTYLINREDQAAAGFDDTINRLDGEIGYPKHFLNFNIAWKKDQWSADYGFNFQSNTVFTNPSFGIEEIEEDPFTLDQPNLGDAFVHYLGGSYRLNDKFQFSLRVNNLFNREPFNLRTLTTPAFFQLRPVSQLGRTVQVGFQANF